ncbi:hypothetical protein SELMODRAFT_408595 [Selaginella moellendorffii]|uniref:F-box domain-containing protein n=1 Tax=Selaginella moellendorffii TaxID=88036 RepID=D8R8S9_SELML|nr:coronatine-insensitive protein homolog 1a [Selaginella moellendorffii]EFJ32115.1 hypothetical protein SELMODRAFT_408595 [Selaginella moellendorffii]|eukprot:XP_002967516.1 coronatine-insensitive protein homolog 1a [Selaginella moellendorffii]
MEWMSDELLDSIFSFIDHPMDRRALSEVCKRWYLADARTRKSITVGFSYAIEPSNLSRRFRNIQALKIKGKPRVSEFGMVVKDWGAYCEPWIQELVSQRHPSSATAFASLTSLHFRRMEVSDTALRLLARGFGSSLQVLRLDKCSGFSTAGLEAVARECKSLRVLYLEESVIEDDGSQWLHELAVSNSALEVLNFFLTGLDLSNLSDLAHIIANCKSLTSLKLGEISRGVVDLPADIFIAAKSLKELAVIFARNNISVNLPKTLTSFAGDLLFPLDPLVCSNFRELDLMSTTLTAEEHMQVIQCCPNLEVLKVRNIIGDAGVATLASLCPKLRRIRIENLEDAYGFCSYKGLITLASRCVNLQHVAIYVSDIANSALRAFGTHCPHMLDFRIVLLESTLPVTELPLDSGVRALLQGCRKITRLAIYLRNGGLTDAGLAAIGSLGEHLTWLLLGCVGTSDRGLIDLASGCRSLQKLELRDCPFTEGGIAVSVRLLASLRFLWIQKYRESNPYDLLQMGDWVVEYIVPSSDTTPSQVVAYRSTVGHRSDFPEEVIPLSQIAWAFGGGFHI